MDFIMYAVAILAVVTLVFMLLKKADVKMTLLVLGLVLLYASLLMGKSLMLGSKAFEVANGMPAWMAPFALAVKQFTSTLSGAGFTVLILFGYATYMTSIGANDMTVKLLTKPLGKIKSSYILVPAVFLIGNLMSLVVPSASSLAIILLATIYPVMRKAGMSPLTAAAVIACTATVMPTPLGADNVAIANVVAALGGEFADFSSASYVFGYHGIVSVPTLIFMAVVFFFSSKLQDKRSYPTGLPKVEELQAAQVSENKSNLLATIVYSILPILPIILLLAIYAINQFAGTNVNLSVEVCVLICFMFALICEFIRKKKFFQVMKESDEFFKGMAGGVSVVILMVAAAMFVNGLYSIGLISTLQTATSSLSGTGMGFVLPLIIVLASMVLVLLTGSGTVLIYTLAALVPTLATAAGISMFSVFVPLSLTGNLMRAVSPISAVIMIVAGTTKENPINIVKRTAIPMISGVIFMFVLSMILL